MISNIPIYRAKKIGSDEYVIGYYSPAYDIHHYIITHLGVDTKVDVVYQMSTDIHKIDTTTLSIHFSDMLDSQGNKIFASLQKDGKGGDILKGQVYGISKGKVWDMVAEYKDTSIWLTRYINSNPLISMPLVYQKNGYRDMKVIGIHVG